MASFHTGKYAHWGITKTVVNWGTNTGVGTSIGGVVTDLNVNLSLNVQDEPNEYGSTIGKVQTDEIYEGTVTILVPQRAKLPGKDTSLISKTLSFLGRTWFCTGIQDVQSNQNFRRMTLKVFSSRYVNKNGARYNCDDQS